MIDTKRFLSLLLALLLLLSAACAAEEDTWICLTCGQDASGDTCAYCGETRDVWKKRSPWPSVHPAPIP